MLRSFIALGALVALAVALPRAQEQRQHRLVPVPRDVQFTGGALPLTSSFSARFEGITDPRVVAAADRALRRLERRTGLQFPRGEQPSAPLVIRAHAAAPAVPALGDDESYTLSVTDTAATLEAPTTTGAIRGLETLLQLVETGPDGYVLPAAIIKDAPRFPWRGLMIDVCRHWIPFDVLRRNLDAMAAAKLNVLHLHLTEDQGFRIESKKYPKLHTMGSDGLFYTQDQMRDVIRYAAERGIRVVPEFDMPGHVTSWLVGHPELASAPGPYQIERKWGIFDPAMDPTKESTYRLLDGFLGEMAALFPDPYMHIGGDENNGKQWAANADIQRFMQSKQIADAHALQAHFNQRLSRILTKHRKKMIGWDEILHPDLPSTIVIQSWRGPKGLAEAASKGYAALLSNGYYLDLMHSTARHYAVDPLPENSTLSPEQARLVLGGEACMWSEFVDADTIDSRIWPRLLAIAERLWSPRHVRDVGDMHRRVDAVGRQFEELGLTHGSHLGRMARRLAGPDATPEAVEAVETLVGALEPVEDYNRPRLRPATQMMPLSRVVDAAIADPAASRRFAAAVDRLLADAPRYAVDRAVVLESAKAWRDLRPAFDRAADGSAMLREALPLAADAADAGALAVEALSWLAAGRAAPPEWRARAAARLDEAARPKAECELVIVPAVRKLVAAAASGRSSGS